MLSCFMVTPEFHFASVWYAASAEGELFFLAFLNIRSHTHADILFGKLLNSPPKYRKAVANMGRGSFKGP